MSCGSGWIFFFSLVNPIFLPSTLFRCVPIGAHGGREGGSVGSAICLQGTCTLQSPLSSVCRAYKTIEDDDLKFPLIYGEGKKVSSDERKGRDLSHRRKGLICLNAAGSRLGRSVWMKAVGSQRFTSSSLWDEFIPLDTHLCNKLP